MDPARLKVLPTTQEWNEVSQSFGFGEGPVAVASWIMKAAELDIKVASKDPAFLHSFWLLTQIPIAARSSNFAANLRAIGLIVSEQPSLTEILGAFSDGVDRFARDSRNRTDLGELGGMAAVGSLAAKAIQGTTFDYDMPPNEARFALSRFSDADYFGSLTREYFYRLTFRVMDYYLSQVDMSDWWVRLTYDNEYKRAVFIGYMSQYCRFASRVVEEPASTWCARFANRGQVPVRSNTDKFLKSTFSSVRAYLRSCPSGFTPFAPTEPKPLEYRDAEE